MTYILFGSKMFNILIKINITMVLILFSINQVKADIDIELKQVIEIPSGSIGTKFGGSIIEHNGKLYLSAHEYEYLVDFQNVIENVGKVYVYDRDNTNSSWTLSEEIIPITIEKDLKFGNNISIDNDYLAISAEGKDVKDQTGQNYSDRGAVYIYKYNSKTNKWYNNQVIEGSTSKPSMELRGFVHIENNNLFIGELNHSSSPSNEGIVLYKLDSVDGKWKKKEKIIMEDTSDISHFTMQMAVSDSIIVLTNPDYLKDFLDGTGETFLTGSASLFIYNRDIDTFVFEEIISPNEKRRSQYFGDKVYIYENEIYIFQLNGNDKNQTNSSFSNLPKLKVYKVENNNASLNQVITSTVKGSMHGWNKKTSVSGNVMVISALWDYLDEDGLNEKAGTGTVHLYNRKNANDKWQYIRKIVPEGRKYYPVFGQNVEIFGNNIYVSAFYQPVDSNNSAIGRRKDTVYVYKIDTTTTSVPTQENKPSTPQITVSPNPISDVTTIGIPAMGKVSVYLTDITGAKIRELWTGTAEVPTSVMMDASLLATGEYFVVVETAEGVISEKIVVER